MIVFEPLGAGQPGAPGGSLVHTIGAVLAGAT